MGARKIEQFRLSIFKTLINPVFFYCHYFQNIYFPFSDDLIEFNIKKEN